MEMLYQLMTKSTRNRSRKRPNLIHLLILICNLHRPLSQTAENPSTEYLLSILRFRRSRRTMLLSMSWLFVTLTLRSVAVVMNKRQLTGHASSYFGQKLSQHGTEQAPALNQNLGGKCPYSRMEAVKWNPTKTKLWTVYPCVQWTALKNNDLAHGRSQIHVWLHFSIIHNRWNYERAKLLGPN